MNLMRELRYLIMLSPLLLTACQATVAPYQQQQQAYQAAKDWYTRGDLLAAEQQLHQLHSRELHSVQSWRLMGNIQFRQQRLDAAERAYRQALALAPGDEFSWHNLSLVKLRQATDTLMQARSELGQLDRSNDELLRQLLRLQRVQLQ